jgi:hypothetical protein
MDDACTTVVEVPSFEAFRALLAETDSREARKGPHRDDRYRVHPEECQVYRVQGPAWSGG